MLLLKAKPKLDEIILKYSKLNKLSKIQKPPCPEPTISIEHVNDDEMTISQTPQTLPEKFQSPQENSHETDETKNNSFNKNELDQNIAIPEVLIKSENKTFLPSSENDNSTNKNDPINETNFLQDSEKSKNLLRQCGINILLVSDKGKPLISSGDNSLNIDQTRIISQVIKQIVAKTEDLSLRAGKMTNLMNIERGVDENAKSNINTKTANTNLRNDDLRHNINVICNNFKNDNVEKVQKMVKSMQNTLVINLNFKMIIISSFHSNFDKTVNLIVNYVDQRFKEQAMQIIKYQKGRDQMVAVGRNEHARQQGDLNYNNRNAEHVQNIVRQNFQKDLFNKIYSSRFEKMNNDILEGIEHQTNIKSPNYYSCVIINSNKYDIGLGKKINENAIECILEIFGSKD